MKETEDTGGTEKGCIFRWRRAEEQQRGAACR